MLSSFGNITKLSLSVADESSVSAGSPAVEPRSLSQSVGFIQADGCGDCVNLLIYPYERLCVISSDPVAGIDVTKREVQTVFLLTDIEKPVLNLVL